MSDYCLVFQSFCVHYEQQQPQKHKINQLYSETVYNLVASSFRLFTWPNRIKVNAIVKQKYQVNRDW